MGEYLMRKNLIDKKQQLLLVSTALLLCLSGTAVAATSGDIGVSAEVVGNCSITATSLAFANYDPVAATAVDGTASLEVTCTNGTTGTVGLSIGTNGSGTATAPVREMVHGTDTTAFLGYQLFNEETHTTVWADGAGDVTSLGDGTAKTLTVYGRIAAGQNAALLGSYSDTVTATVDF